MEKIRRGAADIAAQEVIDEVIQNSGLNNRTTDEASKGRIGYNRVRDIRRGDKGPVRLSEFLVICDTCRVDPIRTLQEIIDRAKEMDKEARKNRIVQTESDAEDMIKSFSEGDQKTLGLAADIEKEKWLEARGGDGR